MAKAKKKELSLEEKLEQALVPIDEQLYKVPGNWCWTYTGSVAEVISGGTPSTSHREYYENGNIPWISPADLSGYNEQYISRGAKMITSLGLEKSSAKVLPKDTVCLSSRAPIGYVAIAENELCTNQGFKNFTPSKAYLPEYLYWYLKSIKHLLEEKASGTTFLELSGAKAARIELPLPPLAEQQRIVEQIESLFAKLDEAKEKAHEIVDKFEAVERAIQYSAFTGELTKKWRLENSISSDTWSETTLQDVCCMKITDGTHKTPTYCEKEEGGIPFISAKDVTTKKICWDNIKYIVPELHEELYARLAPQRDDVLLAKNGTTGVAAIVEDDKIFDLYVTLAVLRPDKSIINPRYLLNIVNSPVCKMQFDEHLTGIGVPNLHLRDIKEVKIPLPLLDEQEEINRIVDSLLKKEERAFEIAKTTIQSIEVMKKTVLAKAFRGELGTNNPDEESATELLRQIMAEA